MIISHVILSLKSFSHIIHLYFVPWPLIDNLTSCDMIMYSTSMCFGMLVVSAIFPLREDQISKHLCRTLVMNNMWIFLNLNEVC